MFKSLRNKFKKEAPKKEAPFDWSILEKEISPDKIQEPVTLAKLRLESGAKDNGSEKALKAYSSHKTKVQNQWINPLQSVNSGYGTAQLSLYKYQAVNYFECYALAQDPLFNKIFNILSETPFANGGEIADDLTDEEKESVKKAEKRFNIYETITKAVRSNFVCGGCLIYMDFGDEENLEEPLDITTIDMKKFKGFIHIDPINLTAIDVNSIDPSKKDYMNPKKWYVIGLGQVHASRFLKFEENVPELVMKPMSMYFGFPLTLLIKQDVANSNLVSQGLANMINRFRNLYLQAESQEFTGGNAANFRKRLEVMSMVQDNFGIYPIKSTENIMQLTTSLQGLADNCEFFYQIIAAKTDITMSILMGKGAQGLSGTLEGERKNFYDRIRSIQASIRENLLKMLSIAYGAETGIYKEFKEYVFAPLEQANEKEKAENLRSYTEIARGLIDLGVGADKAIEWLKGFKDYRLENIEIDLSTQGLMDYDDLQGDSLDDAGQEAQISFNADFKESDHPRDEDGKFTGGVSKEIQKENDVNDNKKKPLKIDSNFLGSKSMDIKELRQRAIDYYKNNISGTSVEHPELGTIHFSKAGYKKPVSFSADERKLRLFPYLPDIVKGGKVISEEKDKRERSNVSGFIVVEKKVIISDREETIRVNIRKDSNGNLYYDHFVKKPLANSDRLNESGLAKGSNNNIPENEEVVNIFFADEETKTSNDRWITIKPNGEEHKGQPLFLDGDETPAQAMKRKFGDKFKDKRETQKQEKTLEPKEDDVFSESYSNITKGIKEKRELLAENASLVQKIKKARYGSTELQEAAAKNKEVVKKYQETIEQLAAELDRVATEKQKTISQKIKNYKSVSEKVLDSLKDVYDGKKRGFLEQLKKLNQKQKSLYEDESITMEERYSEFMAIEAERKLIDKDLEEYKYNGIAKKVSEKLKESKTTNFSVEVGKSEIKDFSERVAACLNGVVSSKWNINKNLEIKKTTKRAEYSNAVIKAEKDGEISTYIHEYMHHLEDENPEMLTNSMAFLKYRTQNEKAQRLSSLTGNTKFRRDEVAKKDGFFDPYCGKIYDDATEIMSMGVQRLFEEPNRFAQEDREYFDFVLANLRGEL